LDRARREEQIRQDKIAKDLGFKDLRGYQDWLRSNNLSGENKLLYPQIGDPPPPICLGPRWGDGSCFDIFDLVPNIEIKVGIKSWENIDKIDLTVDLLGIAGDLALTFGGPLGLPAWFFTEIPEFMTIGRSFDQMETGDPAGGVSVIVDVAITIAQVGRLFPEGGWVGNLAGIGLNFLEISVSVEP
jgi:hypothetical protein